MNGDLKSPAFTIIELLIIITLIGLFAVLSVPRFNEVRSALKAKGAAKKLMADLRYAQSAAMGRDTTVTVFFNDSGHSYYACYNSSAGPCPNGTYLVDPFSGGNFSVAFDTDSQFKGVVFNSSFNGGHNLTFDRMGRPCDANSAPITSNGTVNLSFGYDNFWVNVTAGTGLVTGS